MLRGVLAPSRDLPVVLPQAAWGVRSGPYIVEAWEGLAPCTKTRTLALKDVHPPLFVFFFRHAHAYLQSDPILENNTLRGLKRNPSCVYYARQGFKTSADLRGRTGFDVGSEGREASRGTQETSV